MNKTYMNNNSGRCSWTKVFGMLLMVLFLYSGQVNAQTFSNPTTFAIPDNGYSGTLASMASSPISVTGLTGATPLISVRFSANMAHTWIGDMTIKLVAPNGAVLALMSRPGYAEAADDGNGCCGSSSDFVIANTYTFQDGATTTSENIGTVGNPVPTTTVAPSNGSIAAPPAYTSFAALIAAVGITNLNGTWTVYMGDSAGGDTGSFSNATLTFEFELPPADCAITNCPGNLTQVLLPGQCTVPIFFNLSYAGTDCISFASIPATITQNTLPAPVDDALDCPATMPVRFFRAYANGANPLTINSVQVSAFNTGQQVIRIHTYTGAIGGATLNLAQMTQVGQSNPTVTTGQTFTTIPLTAPVTIPANTNFVVEQFRAIGQPQFTVGASYSGQSAPSYIYSVECGVPTPSAFANFGFGFIHLYQVINGIYQGVPLPPTIVQTEGPANGEYVGEGTYDFSYDLVLADGTIVDNCSFTLTVLPFANPITTMACNDLIHISLDETCTAEITADMVLEGGPYGCYDDYTVELGLTMNGPFNLGNTVTCANVGQTLAVRVTDPNTGNNCWGWLLIEDKLAPEIECGLCLVETESLSGSFNPTTGQLPSLPPCWGGVGGIKNYEAITFTALGTGAYTFAGTSPVDSYGILYSGTFDPASPCTGFLALNDDGNGGFDPLITFNLTAGQTYTIVMSSFGANVSSTYTWTITGPDAILAPGQCQVYCTALDDLLNAETLSDMEAIGLTPPEATDNCNTAPCSSLTYDFVVGEPTSDDMCDDRSVPVTWTVTDGYGNTASCVSDVLVISPELDDVDFPDAVIVECGAISPATGQPYTPAVLPHELSGVVNTEADNTLDEDWPKVNDIDIKTNGEYCNLAVTYSDQTIALCGNAKKIVRTWVVADWCTQTVQNHVQLIKVMDSTAPSITCPSGPIYLDASPYSCFAYGGQLPAATVSDGCSDYRVEVWLNGSIITTSAEGYVVNSDNELPVGTHTLTYRAVDACNNVSECTVTLIVRDVTPPNVICKEFLQVTLNPNRCLIKVPADRYDNGSYDNCCSDDQLVFKVKRMNEGDALFRDTIAFTECDLVDVSLPANSNIGGACGRVDVIMRVYCAGSPTVYSECMVQTFIDDKTKPVITKPDNVTVHCDAQTNPVGYFGEFSWTDACGWFYNPAGQCPNPAYAYLKVDTLDQLSALDDCGEGTIRRTITVTDKCGNTDRETQTVTVRHISDFEVTFPGDQMLTSCSDTLDLTPEVNSTDCHKWPQFGDVDCENLATTWWDERFYGENDACFKIIRHWKVINWCAYDIAVGNTNDDVIPSTAGCEFRPSQSTNAAYCNYNNPGFTTNDCTLWRPGVYRKIKDGGNDITWYKGDGVIEYTQIIKVRDNETPVLQVKLPNLCNDGSDNWEVSEFVNLNTPAASDGNPCPSANNPNNPVIFNVTGEMVNGVCMAPAGILQANAIDCSDKLHYRYDIDYFANTTNPCVRSIDQPGQNYLVGERSPMGLHRVYWEVNDGCGNKSQGNYWVLLRDCKPPTPVCYHGLATVVMPSSGAITLPARFFNHASFDNCTNVNDLHYSYSSNVADSLHTWTCDDIVANGSIQFAVTMYVTDGDGNSDYCTTYLNVNTNGVCGGNFPLISGNVTTFAPATGISQVEIMGDNAFKRVTDGAIGDYNFETTDETTEVRVSGKHDKGYLNGVDVADVIKIQNHILNKSLLDQPYKMLAADVKEDGLIDARDIIEIKKLVLGKTDAFASGHSWRVFDANYALTMNNWASAPDYIMAKGVMGQPSYDVDFNGVKMGDVNLTARANFHSGAVEQRSVGTLNFRANEMDVVAGQTFEVPVKAKDFKNIAGYQFTFDFNQDAIAFNSVKSGVLNSADLDFGTNRADQGIVTTIFNGEEVTSVEDDAVLFTLVFDAKANVSLSTVLTANSKLTPAMAVDGNGDNNEIALEFVKDNIVLTNAFSLEQNTPNPFTSTTTIGYTLPKAGKATLTIYDITGKVVRVIDIDGKAGHDVVTLTKAQLNTTGVMFYQLVSGDFSATKKMVILE